MFDRILRSAWFQLGLTALFTLSLTNAAWFGFGWMAIPVVATAVVCLSWNWYMRGRRTAFLEFQDAMTPRYVIDYDVDTHTAMVKPRKGDMFTIRVPEELETQEEIMGFVEAQLD